MRVFFKKMGIETLRFKPAYNPYTEVSFNLVSLGCATPSMNFFVLFVAVA
jgi:phenylalanyl-tRNA synthetase alpha subunit